MRVTIAFAALICLYVLLLKCCTSDTDNSTADRLEEVLKTYCRADNQLRCPDDVTENTASSCCTGCSCRPSCGLTGSCCYKEDDHYNMAESGKLKCLYPDTKLSHSWADTTLYKFIVGPPPGGCYETSSCNESQKLVAWKTFYPVYSREKRMNYINEDCAKCYGVTDGIHWTARLSMRLSKIMDMAAIVLFLEKNPSDAIYAVFEHPGDDLEKWENSCASNLIESCEEIDFSKTLSPGLAFDDVQSGCLFGPYLPFTHNRELYKNVFCALCSNNITAKTCVNNMGRFDDAVFTSLIDHSFVKQFTKTPATKEAYRACKSNEANVCREVLCPAMQVRDENGRCIYPGKRWYFDSAAVYLNLTFAGMDVQIQTFTNMSEDDILDMFYKHSPWHSRWVITQIGIRSYELGNSSVTEIVALLECSVDKLDPNRFMSAVHKSISTGWVIELQGESFAAVQEFARYPFIHSATQTHDAIIPTWSLFYDFSFNPICSIIFNLTTTKWMSLYLAETTFSGHFIVIDKMFFCPQVELYHSEYLYDEDCRILEVKDPARILFQLEMLVSYLDKTRITVCVEDTDLKIVTNGAIGTFHSYLNGLYGMLTIFVVFWEIHALSTSLK